MSIEINGNNSRPPLGTVETGQADATDTKATTGTGKDRPSARSTADTFHMTSRAAQLQRLEEQIASMPVVDTQRVQEVQQSLATGTLEVQPARVADKLLRFEAGLDKQG